MNPTTPISIPNILTLVRILLTPVFIILLLRHLYWQALAVFVVAGVSDALDGFIARYFNQRTTLGAYLDPVADKLLLASAYISLAVLEVLPAWVTVIVIARDVIISLGIAILTLTQKTYEVRPTIISKCTTAAQLVLVIVALCDPARIHLTILYLPLLWLTAGLTTASGLHYIYIGMNILQAPDPGQSNIDIK
ncbi:CDP-alcohol phosphatidyltransferase family protein [Desulfatitalea alkaliphila]|uniref:CDP-diacylglycerol--glycerol-3-phosphate 3-phosphatidyltransferase n=1 Tax=Desulfatitalea alkaliphila TaxID=2929485 RepID=A0AA41QYI2_9BACT|nr:CDP-alcohol phosphatidyltransferase family protein [Desulfatitalea alkaliphila]MCJ8499352.1 CDP-alcohol phosphatidyltransferase family protein [Desulfatitalea alkaliphila]